MYYQTKQTNHLKFTLWKQKMKTGIIDHIVEEMVIRMKGEKIKEEEENE